MMTASYFANWFLPIIFSALGLGLYDICKKHAVNNNQLFPVLLLTTGCGAVIIVLTSLLMPDWRICIEQITLVNFGWIFLKSLFTAASWTCGYYAFRELPISVVAPIRASAPLWVVLGAIVCFGEIPNWYQALAMVGILAGYYVFSVIGKLEHLSFKTKSVYMVFLATLFGAGSALFDKFLLGPMHLDRIQLQFFFAVDMTLIFLAALGVRVWRGQSKHHFEWRWSIPATGVLLIVSDFLYFWALSIDGAPISILSLIRRASCAVSFFAGAAMFHDKFVRKKSIALLIILLSVAILGLVKH